MAENQKTTLQDFIIPFTIEILVCVLTIPKMADYRTIQKDWDQREIVEKTRLSILQLSDFMVKFRTFVDEQSFERRGRRFI
jgi:hypothetical protein